MSSRQPQDPPAKNSASESRGPDQGWLNRHHWIPFVLPLAVYMLVGSIAPQPSKQPAGSAASKTATDPTSPADTAEMDGSPDPPLVSYPWAYGAQIAATLVAMWFVRSAYGQVPWKWNASAVAYGFGGGLLWIGVCRLGLEASLLRSMGRADWIDATARAGFDPLSAFEGAPLQLAAFLGVRFVGLALIVPIIEEFFLRGFLTRFVMAAEWWQIALGTVTAASACAATVYGVVAHPAEWIAALLWFSLITLLYARTRNLWACVVAHAITNGMLGVYVVIWQDWRLW